MHFDRGSVSKKCQNCHRTQSKQYYYDDKKNKLEQVKQYRLNNINKVKEYQRLYNLRNKESNKIYQKIYREKNKEKLKEYKKIYTQRDYAKLRKNIHNRINKIVSNSTNSPKTLDLISCSPTILLIWLEYQFDTEMNWDNYGEYWHIDHCRPCKSFNLTLYEEQKKCFHWSNLQPLEKYENISKRDKIDAYMIIKQEIKWKSFLYQYKGLFT